MTEVEYYTSLAVYALAADLFENATDPRHKLYNPGIVGIMRSFAESLEKGGEAMKAKKESKKPEAFEGISFSDPRVGNYGNEIKGAINEAANKIEQVTGMKAKDFAFALHHEGDRVRIDVSLD